VSVPRQTQAQRRAATKSRVLAATIDCLVELGYANTSTRHIARRAGVTIGALQHHFAGKAELMAAAFGSLEERIARDFLVEASRADGADADIEHVLDQVWTAHCSPLFTAGLELRVAARTDAALMAAMSEADDGMSLHVVEGMLGVFPKLAATRGFAEAVMVGLATMRGLAMSQLGTAASPDALWAVARPQLLAMFEASQTGELNRARRQQSMTGQKEG
jgi:AcrR family transcriptional regulator